MLEGSLEVLYQLIHRKFARRASARGRGARVERSADEVAKL